MVVQMGPENERSALLPIQGAISSHESKGVRSWGPEEARNKDPPAPKSDTVTRVDPWPSELWDRQIAIRRHKEVAPIVVRLVVGRKTNGGDRSEAIRDGTISGLGHMMLDHFIKSVPRSGCGPKINRRDRSLDVGPWYTREDGLGGCIWRELGEVWRVGQG